MTRLRIARAPVAEWLYQLGLGQRPPPDPRIRTVTTPEQVALLFAVFADWSAAQDGRQDLAALVLYPDGSGGVARDLAPGKRPPVRLDPAWSTLAEALDVLQVGAAPPPRSAPSALAVIGRLSADLVALRDRRDALRLARNRLVCRDTGASSGAPVAATCWARRAAALASDAPPTAWPPLCPACAAGEQISGEIRSIGGSVAATGRELRRHLEAAGLLDARPTGHRVSTTARATSTTPEEET